jgi:hypothetical protein
MPHWITGFTHKSRRLLTDLSFDSFDTKTTFFRFCSSFLTRFLVGKANLVYKNINRTKCQGVLLWLRLIMFVVAKFAEVRLVGFKV